MYNIFNFKLIFIFSYHIMSTLFFTSMANIEQLTKDEILDQLLLTNHWNDLKFIERLNNLTWQRKRELQSKFLKDNPKPDYNY